MKKVPLKFHILSQQFVWPILILSFFFLSIKTEAQVKDTIQKDFRIRINRYEFDPLQSIPQQDTALAALNERSDSIYQLIQFKGSLTREQIITLKQKYNLRLDKYIPNYTYLERVSKSRLKNLQALSYYRWNGNYEPAYKISSTIGTHKFRTKEGKNRKGLLLTLTAFPEANADQLKAVLSSNGATGIKVIDERKHNGNLKIQFQLSSTSRLLTIASNTFVRYIEEVGESFEDDTTTAGTVQSGTPGTTPIWDKGLHGEGQIIGILDGGSVDINHCLFVDNTHTVGSDHRKVVAHHTPSSTPAAHATFVAGIACGDDVNNLGTSANRGEAWAARFTDKPRNSSTMLTDLNEAHADGAFIHTNSWHDEPEAYNQLSEDVDNFLYNNEYDFLCGSSGNVGESIGPPGTAKNALNVSAAEHDPNEDRFGDGNNGPATGNRRKPEIFAPGCNINSATVSTACGIGNWGGVCATSWATPATAGNAALVRQYYSEGWYPTGTKILDNAFVPTGALIKATLLNSTIDMTGIAGYPGDQEGWGLIRLNNALYFPGSTHNLLVWDVHNASGIFTGDDESFNVDVQNAGTTLKVTLVWTDPPADAGSTTPLINDLNLTVTAPNGDVFAGNDFNAGQSRANGGTTDNVNNVEMVQINTPQVGRYVIRINGAAINQGPQGFALVATADTQDPPAPTGMQNTLVVLTQLPGTNPAGAPSQTTASNLMTNLNTYITEASYGVTSINPVFADVTLTTPLGTYVSSDHNPLIEMTQDVVTQLTTADPNVFTRGTAATNDDISRIVILLNDNSFTGDWATTGGWPYSLPNGLTSRLSVSISSVFNDPDKRVAHAMCHQLGMMDLYNHPGVVFAQPHVDNWDIMSNLNNVQPMAWSKEKALWLSTHDPNSILWIPRPAAGASHNEEVPLNFLSSASTTVRQAVAIGLTPGVTDMANENVFYFIEARSNAAGTFDHALPGSGVLLYYVNQNIRQGEGPVRIIDKSVGTATLDDASLDAVGLSFDLTGSYGLKVTRISPAGSEDARVNVEYTPIQTQNDMNIVLGDPYWTSPDIWVDAPDNGYDATPADHGEKPIAGAINRIYFRVHNPGPGTAFDVPVSVRLSEPWHTVGGVDDFNRFVAQKFYPSIPSGMDKIDYVEWTPANNSEPHNCIKVTIENVINDINAYNNSAQQNVEVRESRTHSPYEPVVFHFGITNPYDYYQLVYFRTEGVPEGWTATFAEPKRLLNAHEHYDGSITIQPPLNALVCTNHKIYITSWFPKGNTLIQLGGSTLQVNLRQLTTLTATTTTAPCKRNETVSIKSASYSSAKCYSITIQGCTDPVQANQDIIIRYEDPQGNPVFRTVKTDAFGCYSDTYVVAEGGDWKVTATYPGKECAGSSTAGPEVVGVPLPTGNGNNGNNGGEFGSYLRSIWFSAHIGSVHPTGNLNKTADANIYAMADLSFPVNKNLNLQLMYGLAQMTNSNGATGKNPSYTHLSMNAQAVLSRSYDMKPYLRGGLGYYRNQLHANTMGANIGLGGITAVKSQLLFATGIDFHCPNLIASKDNRKLFFFTVHIGFLFK